MSDLCCVKNLVGPAGKPAIGTVERLSRVAKFLRLEDGVQNATYEGTIVIWWDGRRTECELGGGDSLIDEDGNEWEAEHDVETHDGLGAEGRA